MSSIRRNLALALLIIAILGVVFLGAYGYRHAWAGFERFSLGKDSPPASVVGSRAPGFELESLAGETISLSKLHGIPVVINFWATWCAQCVLEMPGFERTYQKYQGMFNVLAINAGESTYRVQQFAKDIGITFDVLLDPASKVQTLYQINGYPTTFILDKDGIIRVKHIGQLDEDQLASYLLQLRIIQ